jgi:hypothetical protein
VGDAGQPAGGDKGIERRLRRGRRRDLFDRLTLWINRNYQFYLYVGLIHPCRCRFEEDRFDEAEFDHELADFARQTPDLLATYIA